MRPFTQARIHLAVRTSYTGPTLRDHLGLRHPHASLTRKESA
jgi:hypothetical protein